MEFEKSREDRTPRPAILDIAQVDGRWVQIIGAEWDIRYLDTGEDTTIQWDDYTLIKAFDGKPVYEVKRTNVFTEIELDRIHWGPEQNTNPELKEQVCVFASYKKK